MNVANFDLQIEERVLSHKETETGWFCAVPFTKVLNVGASKGLLGKVEELRFLPDSAGNRVEVRPIF